MWLACCRRARRKSGSLNAAGLPEGLVLVTMHAGCAAPAGTLAQSIAATVTLCSNTPRPPIFSSVKARTIHEHCRFMETMEQKLAFFRSNGYHVEHGALTSEEVEAVNAAIGNISHGSADVFQQTTELDILAYHPNIFSLAQRILGHGARLSSFNFATATAMNQSPPADPYGDGPGESMVLNRAWHREDSGNVEGASANEYFCPAVQAIIYLDDVDHRCHCTSIIPESAEVKRHLPKTRDPLLRDGRHHDGLLRIDDYGPFGRAGDFRGGRFHTSLEQGSYLSKTHPSWINSRGEEVARRVGGVDVYAHAGSAVIFNNASFHCRTERHTAWRRRAVRVRTTVDAAHRHHMHTRTISPSRQSLCSRLGVLGRCGDGAKWHDGAGAVSSAGAGAVWPCDHGPIQRRRSLHLVLAPSTGAAAAGRGGTALASIGTNGRLAPPWRCGGEDYATVVTKIPTNTHELLRHRKDSSKLSLAPSPGHTW